MEIPYLWLLRPVFSIAIAYLLVRKIRKPLYKVIVWFMPPNQRFAPGSFDVATKWVNIIGIGFTIIMAACLFWALGHATSYFSANLAPGNPHPQQPTPLAAPAPIATAPVPQSPLMNTETPAQPQWPLIKHQPAPLAHYETPPPAPIPDPMTMPPARPGPALFTDPHYIQVGAFSQYENAHRMSLRLHPQKTWIGFAGQDLSPYKVLLGPYPNRRAASQALHSLPQKGFPRPATDIQYLIE